MKRRADQNRKIWGRVAMLGKRSGLGRDRAEAIMRAICQQITCSTSTSNITTTQADALIAEMDHRIGQIKPAPAPKANITKRQQDTLQQLYKYAGIKSPQGFCKRIIKKPWPQTRLDAAKVHQALEDMVIRRYPLSDILHMLGCLGNQAVKPLLNPFEIGFIADLNELLASKDHNCMTSGRIGKLLEIYEKRVANA